MPTIQQGSASGGCGGFKDPGHAQRFLAAYGPIASHCRPRRHRLVAEAYRQIRAERFATWRIVTGTPSLA